MSSGSLRRSEAAHKKFIRNELLASAYKRLCLIIDLILYRRLGVIGLAVWLVRLYWSSAHWVATRSRRSCLIGEWQFILPILDHNLVGLLVGSPVSCSRLWKLWHSIGYSGGQLEEDHLLVLFNCHPIGNQPSVIGAMFSLSFWHTVSSTVHAVVQTVAYSITDYLWPVVELDVLTDIGQMHEHKPVKGQNDSDRAPLSYRPLIGTSKVTL